LKFLRKKRKLTQAQFSDIVGLANTNVPSWESGNSIPSLSILYKYSKEFNISMDVLLDVDLNFSDSEVDNAPIVSRSKNLFMEDPAVYGKEQVVVPGVDYKAVTVPVEGDSMSPVLMHGDYVVGEEVSDVQSVRQNSLCIVCMAGRLEVKYVTRYEAGLRLVSESDKNKSELVEWGDIVSVWEVRVRITESIGVVGHPDYLRLVGEVEELRKSIDNLKNNKDEN
jgi:transcriptional regulator with XRE-family HTH domain